MLTILAAVWIQWVDVSEAEARVFCKAITGVYAVACMRRSGDLCEVISPRLNGRDNEMNFTRLGEEVAHCFKGDFHKEQLK